MSDIAITKEEKQWAALIGGVLALVFLIAMWVLCVFGVLRSVDKSHEPPLPQRDERR